MQVACGVRSQTFSGDGLSSLPWHGLPAEWFNEDAWVRAFSQLHPRRAVPHGSASVITWEQQVSSLAPALCKAAVESVACEQPHVPQR